MDADELIIKAGAPIPNTDDVYRTVLVTQRDRKNKAIPAVSCFSLSPNDKNMLSVDWDRKTTPEECVARVGATFKMGKEIYKPYENREIYALNVNFIKSLSDIDDVIFDPIFLSKPIKGRVNNPAHSLVVFKMGFLEDQSKEPETLVKIRDHAKDRRKDVNMEIVRGLVIKHRKRL